MRDVDYDHETETAYECFNCGTLVMADEHPGRCEDCGSEMRNRMAPLE